MSSQLQKQVGLKLGSGYPKPIVDHKAAYGEARKKIYALKKRPEVKSESERVYQKHGSRRSLSKKN